MCRNSKRGGRPQCCSHSAWAKHTTQTLLLRFLQPQPPLCLWVWCHLGAIPSPLPFQTLLSDGRRPPTQHHTNTRKHTHTHFLYPTIYMNTAALIKDLEMDLIPHNITLLSQAQCIQSLFCIVRIQLRVIRTDFWGACGWIGLGNGAVGELTKAAPHQPPPPPPLLPAAWLILWC